VVTEYLSVTVNLVGRILQTQDAVFLL